MKKLLCASCCLLLIFGLSGVASATLLTWDYTQNPSPNVRIDNDNNKPNSNNWYELDLPDWYDSSKVSTFTIDMYGYDDNSDKSIDIWRDYESDHTNGNEAKIAGYNVKDGKEFILRLDVVSGNLLYSYRKWSYGQYVWTNFVDVGNLNSISLAHFDSLNSFFIGYACHFTYDKTTLHIEQEGQSTVPEPATILLFGSGLLGLLSFTKIRRKNV